MAFQFKMDAEISELQDDIRQNNDLYKGRSAIIANISEYYDGLDLDTDEQKEARWKRTPFFIYYPKIVESFAASIFKKPPYMELPEED